MSEEFVLGLDAGGGSGRSLLLGLESGQTHVAARHWSHPPAAEGGLGRQLVLEELWAALCSATAEVIARAGVRASQVVGVAASSMRHTLVALDAAELPLLAVPNADARAIGQGLRLAEEHGPELHARSGRWPGPMLMAARLRQLAEESPRIWDQLRSALTLGDWLGLRLSGERATDPTHACETQLYDLDARDWSVGLANLLGIPMDWLPVVRAPGSRLGALRPEVALALGLETGIAVGVGGADTSLGLLGAGAVRAGDLAAIAGTTTPVQLLVDRPERTPQLWTGPYLLPNRYALESNAGAMGSALEFVARALYPETASPPARLLADADAVRAGAGGVLWTGGAGIMDATRLELPVCQLSFSHLLGAGDADERSRIARGVAEGFAFALRANVEQVEALAGERAELLRLGGGMARSAGWAKIVAAVLERPVRRSRVAESTALGTALCAATAAGRLRDLEQAAEALAEPEPATWPAVDDAGYAQRYQTWRELVEARSPADALAREHQLRELSRNPARGAATRRPPRRPRVLVTADIDAPGLAALERIGELRAASYRETRRSLRGESLVEALGDAEILVTEIDLVDVEVLLAAPRLRVVVSCRGNPVNIDTLACSACGVLALNAPGRNAHAVADLTLAFLLMLARKLPQAQAFLRTRDPDDDAALGRAYARLRGDELWGRQVGLVGLGAVGREVARRLAPFGAGVVAFDPQLDDEAVRRAGAEPVSLAELLSGSDFISLHAAVTPGSRGLIDAAALGQLKPGACLVNTARAALVDEEALAEALRSGQLAGAAIDTFSVEPPPTDHALLQLEQVITSPHIGGNTRQVATHQGEIVARALESVFAGQTPRELLNPELLESWTWEATRPIPDAAQLARLRAGPGPAISDLQQR